MQPDSPETRIGRLEREMAGLQQRVEDLSTDVRALTPLVVATAELKIAVTHLQSDVHDVSGDVATARKVIDGQIRDMRQAFNEQIEGLGKAIKGDREEREQAQIEALKDSRQWRRALIIGSLAVLAACITAAATIIAAGVG